jgi:Galactose oxidase, central domain
VFGGYTDHLKRSSIIERYSIADNTWDIVDFKLYQGMEAGHVYSVQPNKLLIIGGKVYGGECSYVHELDLEKKTIMNRRPLYHQRVLSKSCVYKNKYMYVLGGNREAINCERYNFAKDTWEVVNIGGLDMIKSWKCFGYSSYTVNVAYEESKEAFMQPSPEKCRNTCYIFGTDDEPFLVDIDKTTFETNVEGCPIELRLKNYQGACRVNDTTIFIGGGINRELKKIFNTCYMIDLQTKRVTKCENMAKLRYTFSAIHLKVQ